MAIGVQRLRTPAIGEMIDKVEIQAYKKVSDGIGGFTNAFESLVTVWARILQVRADSTFLARQVDFEISHQVAVNSLRELEIERGDRVIWNSARGERVLIIQVVRDLENLGRWTELLCLERSGEDS